MIVKHPTLTGVQRDVPDVEVDRWTASGWVPVSLVDEVAEQDRRLDAAAARAFSGKPDADEAPDEVDETPMHRKGRTHH